MNLKSLVIFPFIFFGSHAMAGERAAKLDTEKQQLSYIFGIQVGQNMMAEGIQLEMDAFTAGVTDMMAGGKPQIDQATAKKVIGTFQQEKAKKIAAEMNKKQKISQTFMANNAKKKGVVTTKSGLQYKIITAGDGATPTEKDKVITHYKGSLLDGTVFYDSSERAVPETFLITAVIQGLKEALRLMKEGAKWEIIVPANLAYGPSGTGQPGSPIGPNETLIFEIELIAITQ